VLRDQAVVRDWLAQFLAHHHFMLVVEVVQKVVVQEVLVVVVTEAQEAALQQLQEPQTLVAVEEEIGMHLQVVLVVLAS
jgi:hypothetical protein